jgi:hypothetical protein
MDSYMEVTIYCGNRMKLINTPRGKTQFYNVK